MSACATASQPFHPIPLDDEYAALTLQLEELGLVPDSSKGKHPVDQPPDFNIAFASFQAELEQYKTFLADQKPAQSIAAAVHTDCGVIGDLTSQDVQAHEDRCFVLQLSNNDPELEAAPHTGITELRGGVEDW
jgi:hypothetical protein